MNQNDFKLVELSVEHLGAVSEIEQLCFSDPISMNNLKAFLIEGVGKGFVSIDTKCEKVSAYGGVIAVAGEAQVLNVATHPSYRRMGLGREIMKRIIDYSIDCGVEYITLEVREGNVPAIGLYSSLGFVSVGRIKGYYKAPVEDALILKKLLCE